MMNDNEVKVKQKNNQPVMDLIRNLRTLQGWTQSKMAKTLGVRQKTISDWENGKSLSRELVIGAKIGYAAAQAGIPLEEFSAGIPDPDPEVTR